MGSWWELSWCGQLKIWWTHHLSGSSSPERIPKQTGHCCCSLSRTKLWTLKFKETSTHRRGPALWLPHTTPTQTSGYQEPISRQGTLPQKKNLQHCHYGSRRCTRRNLRHHNLQGLRKGAHVCPVWTKLVTCNTTQSWDLFPERWKKLKQVELPSTQTL